MTTLEGIDISHWQSGLSIAKADPDFAIMKATDGTSYVDPTCDGFVSQCKSHGALWGVYHFWQGNPTAEADHFVESVAGYIGHGLLVLDFEGAHATSATAAKTWLDRVYAKTGVRPVIYMSQSVTRQFDWSAVAKDYALWVARYGSSSYGDTGAWKSPLMWQYTDSHKTGGYSVDGDYFYGTRDTWNAYATGGDAHTTDDDTPDDGDSSSSGDDDMPSYKNLSYGDDYTITADGEWHTLALDGKDDGSGKDYNALSGPARCTGNLNVTLSGLSKGHEVDLRPVAVDTKSGSPTKVVTTFPATEFYAGGGDTQVGIPFTQDLVAGDGGATRRLRFQIRAYGGEKVTITGARTRLLYWDR